MGNYNRDNGFRGGNRGGFNRGGRREEREMFSAVCSNCGKDCRVPFRPTGNKPVYCSECFEKTGDRDNSQRSFNKPRFEERAAQCDQCKAQFESINAKLEKILVLLQPKTVAEPVEKVMPLEEVKPAEEVKPKKTKKATKSKTLKE